MKKVSKVLATSALIVGMGAIASPASADDGGSWLDGSNSHSNCFYETKPASFSPQYVTYEKWCNIDFNPVTVFLRGVQDGGLYKVEEGKTDIYDKDFVRTFDEVQPFMQGIVW